MCKKHGTLPPAFEARQSFVEDAMLNGQTPQLPTLTEGVANDGQRDELIKRIKGQLRQRHTVKLVFCFRWRLA
jgi:hypothetical protein